MNGKFSETNFLSILAVMERRRVGLPGDWGGGDLPPGGLDIPSSSILSTSCLEKPFTGTLLQNGLSQKWHISAMQDGLAGISCLTGEVRDSSLFPSYKSFSVPVVMAS